MSAISGNSVLVIGNGGREHAIAHNLSDSPLVGKIFVAPGNAGTAKETNCCNVSDLNVNNFEEVAVWCKEKEIDLVIVGPEDPLAKGITDVLTKHGVLVFGPTAKAAEIEASKSFAKDFMSRHGIPTARYGTFTDPEKAIQFIETAEFPALVVKASGLAAGKGVIVAEDKVGAVAAVKEILQNRSFGAAGETIVVEELLEGEEVSCLAFTDGNFALCMPPAQDHKRLLDGDKGPNTGGMGAYCPCPLITPEQMEFVKTSILQKTVDGLRAEGRRFQGVLYAGIMLTAEGPRVLEFNCRFGDPETQVLLPLLRSSLFGIATECAQGQITSPHAFYKDRAAVCVVAVSEGYPNVYAKGLPIHGLQSVNRTSDPLDSCYVIHAGTQLDIRNEGHGDSQQDVVLTNGGRVLAVVGVHKQLHLALDAALGGIRKVHFQGIHFRNDIGAKAFRNRPPSGSQGGVSYADAGVDIVAGDNLVKMIKPAAQSTTRSGCASELGLFGAMFDLKAAGFVDPLLVSGTDGVGTKLLVAREMGQHNTVGQDLVAMCVNDVLCHGAESLFFLDYYACGKLHPMEAAHVIRGIADGCKLAGCALVGGETAEMPGMYPVSGEYDLAGFVVGAVERDAVLPRVTDICVGDVVIGLSSSGLHSNGFSLIRKVVNMAGMKFNDVAPFDPNGRNLGEVVLTPTRIYCRAVLPVLRRARELGIRALAHITGGGILENVNRVLRDDLAVRMDAGKWNVPPVVLWLAQQGGMSEEEVLRTFNCGLGLVVIVASVHAQEVVRGIREAANQCPELQDMRVDVVGEVITKPQHAKHQVMVTGMPPIVPTGVCLLRRPKKCVKVGVLISGSGTNLQALLEHCQQAESVCEISLVLSNVAGVQGLQRAATFGVPTVVVPHRNYPNRETFERAVDEQLTKYGCYIVCLAGFMRILSPYLVNKYRGRLINVHPSLLPSFKGGHAHRLVLEAGVRISGATVHFVIEDVDAGAIIEQGSCAVLPGDTESSLAERVKCEVEHKIFPKAMEMLARGQCSLTTDNKVLWHQ